MKKSNVKNKVVSLGSILKTTFQNWNVDDTYTHAAAVSYYTIFSLPAILIIIINVASIIFGKDVVEGEVSKTISEIIGKNAAIELQSIIANASKQANSKVMMLVGFGILFFSATGLFLQLQRALNTIWNVKTKENLSILTTIVARAKTFVLIICVGLLLLVSITMTGIVAVLSSWITANTPSFTIYIVHLLNILLSLSMSTLLFALIFKFLPDVKISFKSVGAGALVTSILFLIGEYGMTMYFSYAAPASSYGVAGSIVLLLLWVNYSCLLLFFGAEFTQVNAQKNGQIIMPNNNAELI